MYVGYHPTLQTLTEDFHFKPDYLLQHIEHEKLFGYVNRTKSPFSGKYLIDFFGGSRVIPAGTFSGYEEPLLAVGRLLNPLTFSVLREDDRSYRHFVHAMISKRKQLKDSGIEHEFAADGLPHVISLLQTDLMAFPDGEKIITDLTYLPGVRWPVIRADQIFIPKCCIEKVECLSQGTEFESPFDEAVREAGIKFSPGKQGQREQVLLVWVISIEAKDRTFNRAHVRKYFSQKEVWSLLRDIKKDLFREGEEAMKQFFKKQKIVSFQPLKNIPK